MKFTKIFTGLAALFATTAIVGCAEDVTSDQAINKLTSDKLNKDAQEMAQLKAKLQEQDPSVVDVVKSVDATGKETINIVRKDNDTGDMLVAAMVGMTAGMLMSNLMNNSSRGYGGSDYERKKKRGGGYAPHPIYANARHSTVNKSGYSSWKRQTKSNYTKNIRKGSAIKVKNNPSKYSVSTRGQAFKGGSSARSGSYSRGG